MKMIVRLVVGCATLGSAASALAWGPVGHAVVADVADAHLTPQAKKAAARARPGGEWSARS
jgi:hypothetical protein